ncbi:VRR-NUC domain-containing protein, partial [Salmonella enterica subsp. enterica serovar Newport]|nr:VRR-NUC domain-containing protein [Salmonella enterica subsp. enterica serovar Newport]
EAITALLEYASLSKGASIEHIMNGEKWFLIS